MKSLHQRTAYDPWLGLKISSAAFEMDKASQGKSISFDNSREIVGLLKETHEDVSNQNGVLSFPSVWACAVVERLVPEVYGFDRRRAYREEHLEAGLYFILEQLENIEEARGARAEFARSIFCVLGQALLSERHIWYRDMKISNPYRRAVA